MAITNKQFTGLTGAITGASSTMWDDYNIPISNGGSGLNMTTTTINTNGAVTGGITHSSRPHTEQILDRYSLNELVVEHRVQEFELMKLRETDFDYAEHIKKNLAKYASEEVTSKMTFTKKTDTNTDTHSFRGRVWVFSKEELIQMIEEIRNGI